MPTVYANDKRALWGKQPPPHLKHGQNTRAARVYGCNCKVCLPTGRRKWINVEGATGPKDHRTRNAESRARKKGQPVPAGTKHGSYAYHTYNCRCAICKAANSESRERTQNRWRVTARGHWTTVGENETICWPPADAGPDWTCPHPNHKEVA